MTYEYFPIIHHPSLNFGYKLYCPNYLIFEARISLKTNISELRDVNYEIIQTNGCFIILNLFLKNLDLPVFGKQ